MTLGTFLLKAEKGINIYIPLQIVFLQCHLFWCSIIEMKYNNILSRMSHKLEKADILKEKSERRKQLSILEEKSEIQFPDRRWEVDCWTQK